MSKKQAGILIEIIENMQKFILLFLMITLIISCNTTPKGTETSEELEVKMISNPDTTYIVPDSITEFLITACVSDLKKQIHLSDIQFRDSHIGCKVSEIRERHYFLCGQFKSATEQIWIPFATIKTEGYEQWQGGQSSVFCQDSTVVWSANDLSKSLHEKLVSLEN